MSVRFRSLLLLPSAMLALAMMACLGSSPTVTPPATASTLSTATTAPTATAVVTGSTDAREALLQALQAVATAGPYRVVSMINTGTATITEHGEVILPDHFHLLASFNGTAEREYIILGSTAYAKTGDHWTQANVDMSSLISGFLNALDPTKITEVSLVGPEDVNGTPALAYTFVYTNTINGALITNRDKTWVGVANGLPIKQIVDGELNGHAYHTEQTVEYDPSITIEAPPMP